jgi:hypothetical protein
MKCFFCKKVFKSTVIDICDDCLSDKGNNESDYQYDEHLQKDIEDIINIRGVTPRRYIE